MSDFNIKSRSFDLDAANLLFPILNLEILNGAIWNDKSEIGALDISMLI